MIGIPASILILKVILQGIGKSLSQGIEIPVVSVPGIFLSFAVAVIVSLLYVFSNGATFSRMEATDNLDYYNSMLALDYTSESMREHKKQLNHILNVVGLFDRRKHTL